MSVYALPYDLSDGKEVTVRGVVSAGCDRFSINLCSGPDATHDTALHFNPRFDQSEIVLNHHQDGWGDEETISELPFSQGSPYEVKILVKDECFEIFVNGSHCGNFRHRLPVDSVRNVYIAGETTVNDVSFQDRNESPAETHPVPFTLAPGAEIKIVGTSYPDADRFSINLCAGASYTNDTALHFNPRFGESQVIRTHFKDEWGEEERHGDFPFAQGSPYEIRIVVAESQLQVFVNGSYFCDFAHRLPIESVRNVYIAGDTQVNSVTINSTSQGLGGVHPVPFYFNEGKEVIVRGCANQDSDRFSINLCAGADYTTDTALHFNPRFSDSQVVRTHFQDGWGDEERHGGFPFIQGSPYEVKICARESYFQIYVNGAHFCDFTHRLPKEIVKNVYVAGDTTVYNVTFADNSPIYNPPVPFTEPIRGGVAPGRKIFITGTPSSDPERFSVNFMTKDSFEDGDVALHYDARLNYGEDKVVVRNSKIGGDYGDEEREEAYFPFAPGAPFDMIVEVDSDGFRVTVNNQLHCTFNHRFQPFQGVAYLYISGDVELQKVRFE